MKKDGSKYQTISILGHAFYDDYGKDIVCSACSSIMTTTINGILALDKNSLQYEVSDEGVIISYIKEDNTTQKLIQNMVSLLKELEGNYPDNIKVK